jgi:hypothetical protein
MNTFIKPTIISALAAAACLFAGSTNLRAQEPPPPGDFNPAQMRQRMLDRLREQLEVTDDSEWKTISERITKIMELRRSLRAFGGGGFGFPGGPGGPPPPNADGQAGPPPGPPPGLDNQVGPNAGPSPGGPPGSPPGFGGPGGPDFSASPEVQALRQAIESKASATELKAKLETLVEARKKAQADLLKAQDDLRQLLSVRQEAIAVASGLL